ncbi:MAG: hypothetical protein ABIN61_00200 [candidate division WOR-3 bacterium]
MKKEELYYFLNLMFNLPYEDEFRKVKVKTKKLDEFLEEVRDGKIKDPKEFLREGLRRTITPALLSIIREKLRIFAEKNKDNDKGKAAGLILGFLSTGMPLDQNGFFVTIFIRSALNRPLADDRKVWEFIYVFLPKKVETGEVETIKKASFNFGEGFEERESGLLTPKEERIKEKSERKLIIPK